MSETAPASTTNSIEPTPSPSASQRKPLTWKQKFVRGSLIALAVLLALFFIYRAIGTSHYVGTVGRVYEKGEAYRIEFWDEKGQVHVVGNTDIRFPYFKLDTADLHAELNRLSKSGDLVELKVWGFRYSWLSMFPNAIAVEFKESAKERNRRRAEALADAIIAALKNQDALKQGIDVRAAVIEAVERGEEQLRLGPHTDTATSEKK